MSDTDGKPAPSAPPPAFPGRAEVIAAAVSVGWLLLSGLVLLIGGIGAGGPAGVVLVLVVPVALLWIGLFGAHSARVAREESHRLRAEIETLQRSLRTQSRGGLSPELDRRLATIERAARQTETALSSLGVPRPAPEPDPAPRGPAAPQQPDDAQSLPGSEPAPAPQGPGLDHAEMARALNFPDNDQDRAGFAALRKALRDHRARQLIQASQDVLTLLSQDGIYMDDLVPDTAPPEVWRRFAQGERGAAVAGLRGIRDEDYVTVAGGRMRSDTIFRDAAHHFLRLFDRMLTEFALEADDDDLAALADSRTARAFMLLGQGTGSFD